MTGAETGLSGLTNVHIHRGIEDVALAEMYRNVGVLLLPLADSTANNALREGMASGLPVAAPDLPAVRAYVPDGGAMLVSKIPQMASLRLSSHFGGTSRFDGRHASAGGLYSFMIDCNKIRTIACLKSRPVQGG